MVKITDKKGLGLPKTAYDPLQEWQEFTDTTPQIGTPKTLPTSGAKSLTPLGDMFHPDWMPEEARAHGRDALRTAARTALNTALGSAREPFTYIKHLTSGWAPHTSRWAARQARGYTEKIDAVNDYYRNETDDYADTLSAKITGAGGTLFGAIPEIAALRSFLGPLGPYRGRAAFLNPLTQLTAKYWPYVANVTGVAHKHHSDSPAELARKNAIRDVPGIGSMLVNPYAGALNWALPAMIPSLENARKETAVRRAIDLVPSFMSPNTMSDKLTGALRQAIPAAHDYGKQHPGVIPAIGGWSTLFAQSVKNGKSPSVAENFRRAYSESDLAQGLWQKLHYGNHSPLLAALGIQGDPAVYQRPARGGVPETIYRTLSEYNRLPETASETPKMPFAEARYARDKAEERVLKKDPGLQPVRTPGLDR